jgi:hypothetical protein
MKESKINGCGRIVGWYEECFAASDQVLHSFILSSSLIGKVMGVGSSMCSVVDTGKLVVGFTRNLEAENVI